MEALKRYEEVVAAGERIVGGPDTVANRPGAPAFETTYQIPIEYEKGRARFPAAVAAERERLAPPAETATPGQLKAASAARTKLALKHITPEELERTPALGHVGTVVQAEGQKVVTPVAEEFTLAQNPRFAEMADAFVEAVAKTYRPAALVKRAAEGILDIEQARLKRTGGAGFIGRSGALRILGAVFKDVSAQLVRSPRMRAEVVKAIRARAPELPAEHIEGRLLDLGESHLLERPINYVETTAGKAVNYLDEMADVAAKKPEIMNLVRAEALRELAEVVAEDASKARAAGAIIDTIVSFGMDRFEAPYVASKFVQRVAIEGGPMPPALNRIGPAELAAELASPGRDYIGRIASAARISRKAAARRLERITTSLNNDYAPPSKSLRDHLPTSADLEQALVPGGVLTPQESPFGITAVHRGFESTAGWLYKAMDAAESQKWWRSAQRIVGMNLTAGKPSTHIYNSFSNMTLQVLRRGTPPNFAETAKVWLGDYRGGKLAGTQLEKILRGVERSGLTNTTVVEAELGTIRAPTPLTPGASKVLKPFHAWRRGLGRVYRWGDNAFKIDEAVRNAKILDGRISELAPGDTLDLKVSRRRIATLQKLSDGDIQVAVRNVGQTPSQAVIVGGQEAWNLVGRAAAKSAQALFFDYSDVGNWIHALRSAPGIGLVSPFLTWSYKALDIPGIKRGLVGELLLGDAQILTPSSNASVNAAQFRGAVALSARRLVMMNAMRADVLDKDDRALRSILNRVPRNAALIVLDNVTNPGFVGFKDWQASYFAEPTDALFRLGIGAYVTLSELAGGDFAPQTLYQRDARGKPDFALAGLSDDEQRGMMWRRNLWRKNATGELWALDDGLRLAGLSGHPLMQLVYDIRASARPGRATAVSPAAVWRNFDALLTGGLVGDVIDVGIAADDPDSPWSSRALERGGKDYPPEADDDVRWALRKITSLGWRVEKIGPKAKEHFSDLRAAFRSSVLKAGKDRLASLKARGATAEEIDPVKDDLKFLARIVDEEMRAIEDGYRDVIKKVRAPRDPEVVEEPEPAAAAGGR